MTKKGRPFGRQHPVSIFEFWQIVVDVLPEQGMMRLAYLEAERRVQCQHGRRRFKNFQCFRNAKCVFLKRRVKLKQL